jgi:hypothetical protein
MAIRIKLGLGRAGSASVNRIGQKIEIFGHCRVVFSFSFTLQSNNTRDKWRFRGPAVAASRGALACYGI